jgi:hypothetical protein
VSTDPTSDQQEQSASTAHQLTRDLPLLLKKAMRARIYDRRGKLRPVKKRGHQEASSVLLEITDLASVAGLGRALQLRPDSQVMDWMQSPDLWLEFAGENGAPLVTLGLLRPDWLRWDPHGDLQLAAPESLTELLADLGLSDAGPEAS